MRRILTLVGAALIGSVLLPTLAQAQVVVQYAQPAPIIVTQPVRPAYYVAPSVTYRSSYTPTYSYYPSTTVYSAPAVSYSAPVVSYSAPVVSYSAPVVTYAAPAAVVTPSVVQQRTYYGYGIFRPRGYYTETRVYP
jgi:hypothetical protein